MSGHYPSLDEVRRRAGEGNLIPIYREVVADLETPVSAYLKVASGANSFLLESVEGGERLARYSFIGTQPYRIVRTGAGTPAGQVDPLRIVEAELAPFRVVPVEGLPRLHGGAVGYIAYDAARYFEPRLTVPEPDPVAAPESVLLFVDTLLVFDHVRHTIKVVSHARLDGDIETAYRQATWRINELVERLQQPLAGTGPSNNEIAGLDRSVRSNMTRERYTEMVERGKEYIVAGDCIQVVLSQRFTRDTDAHPFNIYRSLRAVNPSPYMYFLDFGDFQVIGASPEMMVRVDEGTVSVHPIAGTRRRGATPAEDEALEVELSHDIKERAEHAMLLDLGRNDVGRVSEPGSVEVTQVMDIERYSHVMHLVSHVNGRLRADRSPFDAVRAGFPAGTVSGAPKIRAMEIIAELEPDRRGPYAGCVAYFDLSGNIDSAITIRTIVMKGHTCYVQAGGGIVYDSVPDFEFEETVNKSRAVLRAIEQAEVMFSTAPLATRGY